jgi:protein SCO1
MFKLLRDFQILPAMTLACVSVGVPMLTVGCREQQSSAPGQAGVAYIETEDGKLERLDDVRFPTRTLPPADQRAGQSPEPSAPPKIAGDPPDSEATAGAVTPPGNALDGSDEEWLTKFSLIERSGKRVGSSELKGQPYVAGFFFTSCPTICPKQNEKVRQLQKKFAGQPVRFLSISCDPEVDTPEVLSAYADRFDADPDQWLFLTGDMTYIRRVGAEFFGLGIMRYAHPEKFALIDAEGKRYGYYTWSDANQWEALQADITKMIAAGGTLEDKK